MGSIDKLLQQYQKLTPQDAPHLHRCVDALFQKAGVEKVPIYWYKGEHPFLKPLIAAVGGGSGENGKVIILGPQLAAEFGFKAPRSAVSREFEAVLAHEISHLKHDMHLFSAGSAAKISLLAGPIAGVIALACIRHHNKPKHEQLKDPHHADLTLVNDKGELQLPTPKKDHGIVDYVVTTGKYMAAAALGLTAGAYVSKLLHHRIEYNADRYSAELLGNTNPMKDALAKAGQYIAREEDKIYGKLPPEVAKIARSIDNYMKEFIHPPITQRIEQLNQLRL